MKGYLIIDVETSGLPDFRKPADHPDQPRMAEFGAIFTDDMFRFEREYSALIRRDGWSMNPEASAVNGITDEMLDADGLPLSEVLQVYTDAILGEGRVVVAFHAQNDCKLMRGELRRLDMDDLFEITHNICAMRSVQAGKLGIKKLNGKGGFPRLVDVCAHFGLPQEAEPHRALNGARALLPVVQKLNEMSLLLPAAVHRSKNHEEIANNV